MSPFLYGHFGSVLCRLVVLALGSMLVCLSLGSLAVSRGWYDAWSYPTLLALASSALVFALVGGLSRLVELEAGSEPRAGRLVWCWVQLCAVACAGWMAVKVQFFYAHSLAESGPEAARLALLKAARDPTTFERLVDLGLFLAIPMAWVGVGRIRRLPFLSQLGVAVLGSLVTTVAFERSLALLRWGLGTSGPAPEADPTFAVLGDALFLLAMCVAFSVLVVHALCTALYYALADRLHDHWLRTAGEAPGGQAGQESGLQLGSRVSVSATTS